MTAELFPAGPESESTALPKWVNVIRCLTVACSVCDTPLGVEDEGITYHYLTIEEVREDLDRQDWTIGDDGPLCEVCTKASAEVTR